MVKAIRFTPIGNPQFVSGTCPLTDNNKSSANVTPLRPTRPCPECKRPSQRDHYPFCSARCRNVDLNRWLTGAYVLPAVESADDSDDELDS
ncbi:DNA gyrase inhibitor YacG [Phyllobacterium endophyticum]|nr:DNA gyrase inhibitor YacG [Phyllobacterium endophyticum]